MTTKAAIVYPESDGKPMADNTLQALWIFVIHGNLTALYRTRDDVFVAADNFWYPVEGELFRMAPDVYVVFGRPKGHRGSYQQWLEGNVPLTVVFEVLSPSNDDDEMQAKFQFYEEHGVQEYYVFDPFSHLLEAYTRGPHGAALVRRRFAGTFTSPLLGIRFDLTGDEMRVYYPNGERFLTFDELKDLQERETARASTAETRASAAETRASAAETLLAAEQERTQRLSRLVELLGKAAAGPLSPKEQEELAGLRSPGSATSASGYVVVHHVVMANRHL